MITDIRSNMLNYRGININLDTAIDYLLQTDLTKLPVGKYEIQGDEIFILIQNYVPKAVIAGKCEAHKNYIDIQYIIEGSEVMGYAPVEKMTVTEAYNTEKDVFFMAWSGNLIHYTTDMFAVFFPQDAHMPGITDGSCEWVKKAVVKVKVQ